MAGGVTHPWPGGVPCLGVSLHPDPTRKGPRTSHSGTPGKDMGPVEVLWNGDGVTLRKDMGPVEVLWDGDGVPPPLDVD